jgi:hypothetical protein
MGQMCGRFPILHAGTKKKTIFFLSSTYKISNTQRTYTHEVEEWEEDTRQSVGSTHVNYTLLIPQKQYITT